MVDDLKQSNSFRSQKYKYFHFPVKTGYKRNTSIFLKAY